MAMILDALRRIVWPVHSAPADGVGGDKSARPRHRHSGGIWWSATSGSIVFISLHQKSAGFRDVTTRPMVLSQPAVTIVEVDMRVCRQLGVPSNAGDPHQDLC